MFNNTLFYVNRAIRAIHKKIKNIICITEILVLSPKSVTVYRVGFS